MFDRTLRGVSYLYRGNNTPVFAWMWRREQALRPVLGVLVLAGVVGGVRRRHAVGAWLCGAVVLHAAALAVFTGAGSDRYAVPFDALLRVAAVYGLWCVFAWVVNDRSVGPRAEASVAGAGGGGGDVHSRLR